MTPAIASRFARRSSMAVTHLVRRLELRNDLDAGRLRLCRRRSSVPAYSYTAGSTCVSTICSSVWSSMSTSFT